ncbi:cupin domain-containing protein [Mycolicibacterium septicum]|uniref:cupin domain-containing protein n=1 Tax=Mycolicibacterium septicum TaxID=98668 RepID=UPI0023E11649|nr:cupin domain-containing protein [Mycolicibacterium septicum]MDF3335888.1 cupin domain-containing protein [Mycolicibacterium septicum]
MTVNRRKILGGAGLAGAAAATGVGVDRLIISSGTGTGDGPDKETPMSDDAARFGDPRLPAETITSQSHLFHLGASPKSTHDGGWFQQANEDNFPILKGQEASLLMLTLQPGGIREPHWHPSAWELNIVTSGVATWIVIDGNGNYEAFDQHVNDIVFAPQGSFHYFENRGPDDMSIIIIQNTSAPEDKDNIGIGESLSRLPPRVLSAVFGVPAETFSSFKKIDNAVVILRSP